MSRKTVVGIVVGLALLAAVLAAVLLPALNQEPSRTGTSDSQNQMAQPVQSRDNREQSSAAGVQPGVSGEDNVDDGGVQGVTTTTIHDIEDERRPISVDQVSALYDYNSYQEHLDDVSMIADVIPSEFKTDANLLVDIKERGSWRQLYAYNRYRDFSVNDVTTLVSNQSVSQYKIDATVTICDRVTVSDGPEMQDYSTDLELTVAVNSDGKLVYYSVKFIR